MAPGLMVAPAPSKVLREPEVSERAVQASRDSGIWHLADQILPRQLDAAAVSFWRQFHAGGTQRERTESPIILEFAAQRFVQSCHLASAEWPSQTTLAT